MQNSPTFQHPLSFMAYLFAISEGFFIFPPPGVRYWGVGGKRLVISMQGVATPNFIEGLAPFQAKLSFFLGCMQ